MFGGRRLGLGYGSRLRSVLSVAPDLARDLALGFACGRHRRRVLHGPGAQARGVAGRGGDRHVAHPVRAAPHRRSGEGARFGAAAASSCARSSSRRCSRRSRSCTSGLFFALPFYVQAASLDLGHALFLAGLCALSLASLWDPLSEWLLRHPLLAPLLPASASFAAPVRRAAGPRALGGSRACGSRARSRAAASSPPRSPARPRASARRRLLLTSLAVLLFPLGLMLGAARIVPAAPLRLDADRDRHAPRGPLGRRSRRALQPGVRRGSSARPRSFRRSACAIGCSTSGRATANRARASSSTSAAGVAPAFARCRGSVRSARAPRASTAARS